jgi:hypothetical protein
MSKRIRELMITPSQAMLLESLLQDSIQNDQGRSHVPWHDPEQMERLADRAKVLQYVRELIHSVETGDALYEVEAQHA